MYILNYPCNDDHYFYHITSISKEQDIEEYEFFSYFPANMYGYNISYDEYIESYEFGKNYFIVDIDNKKLYINEIYEEILDSECYIIEEDVKFKTLLNYIENIIKKDKANENSFIGPYTLKLKKSLEVILSKNPENPYYTSNPKNKYVNFFKISQNIVNMNKRIQEVFYDFYLNFLMLFFQDYTFDISFHNLKKEKNNEEIFKKLNILREKKDLPVMLEDCLFFRSIREALKYKLYFEDFLERMNTKDIFKIPFLFSEEFINIKIRNSNNSIMDKISYFSIIDSFYLKNKDQIINITLNSIAPEYINKLKEYFDNIFDKEKKKVKEKKQLMTLNKKIINKYIYLLNNFYDNDELNKLFPSIQLMKDNIISSDYKKNIFKVILDSFEQNNIIEILNYLIYGLVYIFAISIPLYSFKKIYTYLNRIKYLLVKLNLFSLQFTYILTKTFYKLYLIHKNKKIYPHLDANNIKIYFDILINDILKESYLFPNEEMRNIYFEFFGKKIYEEKDCLVNTNSEEMNDETGATEETNFNIERNKNFICFMKHCFTNKKILRPVDMINIAMKGNKNNNIIINGKVVLQPTINIKFNDYFYSSNFFTPKKIYNLSQSIYDDFFDKEINMNKLNIKVVRDIITNLIEYGLYLKINEEFIPIEFLADTLYLLRNYEEKYIDK